MSEKVNKKKGLRERIFTRRTMNILSGQPNPTRRWNKNENQLMNILNLSFTF